MQGSLRLWIAIQGIFRLLVLGTVAFGVQKTSQAVQLGCGCAFPQFLRVGKGQEGDGKAFLPGLGILKTPQGCFLNVCRLLFPSPGLSWRTGGDSGKQESHVYICPWIPVSSNGSVLPEVQRKEVLEYLFVHLLSLEEMLSVKFQGCRLLASCWLLRRLGRGKGGRVRAQHSGRSWVGISI